ncbi:UNVERIFIED_CONTAM: hypothetical protein K2H54_015321 [Gekko kuhli]
MPPPEFEMPMNLAEGEVEVVGRAGAQTRTVLPGTCLQAGTFLPCLLALPLKVPVWTSGLQHLAASDRMLPRPLFPCTIGCGASLSQLQMDAVLQLTTFTPLIPYGCSNQLQPEMVRCKENFTVISTDYINWRKYSLSEKDPRLY